MIALHCGKYEKLIILELHRMTPLELLLAWVVVSVPVGLLVGKCIARQGQSAEQRAYTADKRLSVQTKALALS
jgi:hypothetical protein